MVYNFLEYGSLEAALQSNSDVIKLLLTVFPMHGDPSTNAEKFKTEYGLPKTDKFPRTLLLLSLCQMIEENYPVPLKGELAKKLVPIIEIFRIKFIH